MSDKWDELAAELFSCPTDSNLRGRGCPSPFRTIGNIAAALRELGERAEKAEAERDALRAALTLDQIDAKDDHAEVAELRTENERLRADQADRITIKRWAVVVDENAKVAFLMEDTPWGRRLTTEIAAQDPRSHAVEVTISWEREGVK